MRELLTIIGLPYLAKINNV